jgi:outer membrane receptor protein involved in Fe transport
MKRNRYILLLAVLLGATAMWAQTTVKGTVTDKAGAPLIGVTVVLDGTTDGAATGADGTYDFTTAAKGEQTLRASYVGFSTETSKVTLNGGAATADFKLGGDALGLDALVVTGVRNERSKLESSVSISTLSPDAIDQTGARSTAEIFRSIPGIRSEASGGEGNTNITARGVPISSGGSKYLQLQEDGLPIMQFGDIAFATSDIFLRADPSVGRIEAIRGGSASTASSNSPAGIINFISNTGAKRGGSVATTIGVDHNSFRTEFGFGSPLANGLSFHVGGFVRQGEGVRTAGFTANQGGQIKANLTKSFENGYVRVYYKYLNDRTPAFLAMPIDVSGTNANPTWAARSDFDPLHGTLHSPFLLQNTGLGSDGQLRRSNVADGMHPISHSVGTEFAFDLDGGWKVEDRARMSFNSGRFVSPFAADLGDAATLAASVGGAGSNMFIANTSTPYTGKAMRIHMFDTELNNFDNIMNDAKVSKRFGVLNATLGYFSSVQNINMSWLWNSYMMEMKGSGARLLDVVDGAGLNHSQNGLYAYGVPAWGNCCQRNYNMQYTTSAPYANIGVEITKDLNFDGSVRWDVGNARGTYASSVQSVHDMNNDGIIQEPEKSVSGIDNAKALPVVYNYNYLSYSAGVNYKLNDKAALFARYSLGGAAKADRILFSGLIDATGNTTFTTDKISQAELGFKTKFEQGGLFVTAFASKTNEQGGFEATTQKIIANNYQAYGIEVETALNFGDFTLRGGLTGVKANIIARDNDTATISANIGKTPRRQAAVIFNLAPVYNIKGGHSVGLNLLGTSSSFAQDDNKLVMPGYVVVNLFANIALAKQFTLTLSGNNLLNTIGITETEDSKIVENTTNLLRGRSILGRSITAGLRYAF